MRNNNNPLPEILFLISFVSLLVLFHVLYKKYYKTEVAENVMFGVCETCQGKGETKQKTADMIYMGRYYMFLNKHKIDCSECKENKYICIEAKKMLESLKEESKEKEERVILYSCPDCFGEGTKKF
jgi:hypothetical protein